MAIITNPSTRTISERNKFKGLLDDFTTFFWDGYDMFENFGAFIINERKGSLKMFNGASFKNEYSKPQFQNGYTNLAGVTFDTQTINFTIGIYWISIEDYRILMNCLHPYKVARLQFSFDKIYGYNCKLQAIKDSTRYIVGKETKITTTENNINLNNSRLLGSDADTDGYRYYTELQLTFDVIGPQCAVAIEYEVPNTDSTTGDSLWSSITESHGQQSLTYYYPIIEDTTFTKSDLEMPFKLKLNYYNNSVMPSPIKIEIRCKSTYTDPIDSLHQVINTVIVCVVVLKNLEQHSSISLSYDSAQGLIYWKNGNKEQILSLLSVSDTGMRIVDSLDVKQCYWPGTLDHPELEDVILQPEVRIVQLVNDEEHEITENWEKTYWIQRRTNVI